MYSSNYHLIAKRAKQQININNQASWEKQILNLAHNGPTEMVMKLFLEFVSEGNIQKNYLNLVNTKNGRNNGTAIALFHTDKS